MQLSIYFDEKPKEFIVNSVSLQYADEFRYWQIKEAVTEDVSNFQRVFMRGGGLFPANISVDSLRVELDVSQTQKLRDFKLPSLLILTVTHVDESAPLDEVDTND